MSAIGARLRVTRYLLLVAAIIAAAVSLTTLYTVGSSGVHAKRTPLGVGQAQILIDSRPSILTAVTDASAAQTLAGRAPLYAEYATGQSVRARIANLAGVPLSSLSIVAETNQTTAPGTMPTAPAPSTPNSIVLTALGSTPLVSIATQSSSAATAQRLASATVTALRSSINGLQATQGVAQTGKGVLARIVLRPLGAAIGNTVYKTPHVKKAILVGVLAFIVLVIVILALDDIFVGRRRRRANRRSERALAETPTEIPG